jgi:hypothetical protein
VTTIAIGADKIDELIRCCVLRGLKPKIIADNRKASLDAVKTLERAGAEVKLARNIHTKLICVDSTYFVEGSFNWLSAKRYAATGEEEQLDVSIRYRGSEAEKLIGKLLGEIESRVTR